MEKATASPSPSDSTTAAGTAALSPKAQQLNDKDPMFHNLIEQRKKAKENLLLHKREAGKMEKNFFLYSALTAGAYAMGLAFLSVGIGMGTLYVTGLVLSGLATLGFGLKTHHLKIQLEDSRARAEAAQIDFQFNRDNVRDYSLSKMQSKDIAEAIAAQIDKDESGPDWQNRIRDQRLYTESGVHRLQ